MSAPKRRVPAAQRGARLTRRTPADGASPSPSRRLAAGPARHSALLGGTPGGSPTDGPHPVELAGLLHELTVRLLSADSLEQALDRLAALAVAALPGVRRCSVVLIGEGGPLTEAAAGPAGETFDRLQYAGSAGPGLEAARTRLVVTSADLGADDRWPDLRDAARADGLRAVAAIPLDVRRTAVGAVSVYPERGAEVEPAVLVTAMALAGQSAVLLGELHRREALTEGAEVDRAVGVIIAQRGCGVQEAYAILQESAQRLGLPRGAVAGRLVAAAARNAELAGSASLRGKR
ncbi:GAF and ANTAR domain-containing protein [Actinoplanes sp. NEAU-A12]|uniref:GAF and ANTAR domain-containing protein n=1 Tax=Actinoplanes sandaracinus TaxID=3045177 RepID=A0ABT6WQI9_9ACTN|nr:GAF and ANTAR domain-containing protein [Actinoplanes sandaracinus]MDI6101989.1 GAF and ANTAR domain-containing protein [Actinoplanes sandaracinus]